MEVFWRLVGAAASKLGMRNWETEARIKKLPAKQEDESDEDDDDAIPTDEVHKLLPRPAATQKQCPRLRTNLQTNFIHESIYESSDGDFVWITPHHRKASRRDVANLEKIIVGMTGRNAYLKPDDPPQELLQVELETELLYGVGKADANTGKSVLMPNMHRTTSFHNHRKSRSTCSEK